MYTVTGRTARIRTDSCRHILVFGDLHGDHAALSAGLARADREDLLVFLGDYADRGPQGVEVIETVHDLLLRHPERVIALKGNHEDYSASGDPRFHPCDLVAEARRKRGSWDAFFPRFREFVSRLLLTAIVPDYALFVHGGISSRLTSPEQLVDPDEAIETACLWNDPVPTPGEHVSLRGIGRAFGPDISRAVCQALSVRYIVRSHEPRKASQGPCIEHDGRVITTNATSWYGGKPFLVRIPTAHGEWPDLAADTAVEYLV